MSNFLFLERYIYDSFSLGCDNCHRGFIACSDENSDEYLDATEPEPDGQPPYPQSTEEVIESHKDISEWFDRQTGYLRAVECARHITSDFEEITRYPRDSI